MTSHGMALKICFLYGGHDVGLGWGHGWGDCLWWIYRNAYCHANGNMWFRYILYAGQRLEGGTPAQIFDSELVTVIYCNRQWPILNTHLYFSLFLALRWWKMIWRRTWLNPHTIAFTLMDQLTILLLSENWCTFHFFMREHQLWSFYQSRM